MCVLVWGWNRVVTAAVPTNQHQPLFQNAPAKVPVERARQRRRVLVLALAPAVVHLRVEGADHPGRAEPALRGVELREPRLDRVRLPAALAPRALAPAAEPLHSRDGPPVQRGQRPQARVDGHADVAAAALVGVGPREHDGARSAAALAAGHFLGMGVCGWWRVGIWMDGHGGPHTDGFPRRERASKRASGRPYRAPQRRVRA